MERFGLEVKKHGRGTNTPTTSVLLRSPRGGGIKNSPPQLFARLIVKWHQTHMSPLQLRDHDGL